MKVKRLKEILSEFSEDAEVVTGECAGRLQCVQTSAVEDIGCVKDLIDTRWELFKRKLSRNKKAKYVLLGSLKAKDDYCHLSG